MVKIRSQIGHEKDDITHGVGSAYFPRKCSHIQPLLHFGRLLWSPCVDFVLRNGIYRNEIFCGSGDIIHFST